MLRFLILCCLLCSGNGVHKRVEFAPGATGVVLRGTVSSQPDVYVLTAGAGQTLSCSLTASGGARLTVSRDGKVLSEHQGQAVDAQVQLSAAGDYSVTVHRGGTYTLKVKIR